MEKKLRGKIRLISCLVLLFFSVCMFGCGNTSNGEYSASVILSGGSGKAYIESPCKVTVKNGEATAHIVWSSPHYDYMIVDGKTFYPVNSEGNSEFEIPVRLDEEMDIQADTTAMSTPHLIDYTLVISLEDTAGSGEVDFSGKDDESQNLKNSSRPDDMSVPEIDGLTYLSTDDNSYAECFLIHRYDKDFVVIAIDDGRKYLIVPENENVPENLSSDITLLKKPIDRIYLAASSAMCHFDTLGVIDKLLLTGTMKDDWYIDSAKEAMESGKLLYGGKYSAPDYEQMVMSDVDLAIESTMILHVPKVQEKLEQIGIPVFIDRSSYEPEPLGRCEWVKVYGAITGTEDKAQKSFKEQEAQVKAVDTKNSSGKSVAIFSLNSNHQIVTRKENDYFAKMTALSGGSYLSPETNDESASSQATISVEAFYDYAVDADILIYNATITNAPTSLSELVAMDVTFGDFKAVNEGNVWYTDKSFHQFADRTGDIISDLYAVIAEGKEDTEFFHKLK